MKKTVKKITATGLVITSVMGLVACGNSTSSQTSVSSTEVTKPDSIKVMVDTVVNESNGAAQFYEYLESVTGLKVEWIRPDHSGYYDAVSNAFNADTTIPDVVQLSSDYYSLYASNGFLWNMTDAWNNSEVKNSGRLVSTADKVIEASMVLGEDGQKALYGLPTTRGNGCVTYIKKAWLDAAGIKVSDVDGKTMDFNTYYSYLKKMQEAKGHYVISGPGFISKEAPYTNYLPEFYQQAHYTFYKNSAGQYVDGFSEKAMQDALQRIQTAVADGVIDKETLNNSTANARDKFYSTDPAAESGVFTYWAGKWANTLKVNLEAKGLDGDLVALKPVKELGAYIERVAAVWAITSQCKNPEGTFKYFIEPMLDGGEGQIAWTYGAKGTHWDTVAESVTLQGKESEVSTYKEGEFHLLPSPEKPNTLMANNNIDPLLALAKYNDSELTPDGKDPGDAVIPDLAKENEQFFIDNSTVEVALPVCTELNDNITDINTARNYVISQTALGYMSVSEGMEYYRNVVGNAVDIVIKAMNN